MPGALLNEPVRLTLAGREGLQHDVRAALALDGLEPHEGHRIDGILGADFMSRYGK